MAELQEGCVGPARGPIGPRVDVEVPVEGGVIRKEVQMVARVGREAIDFEANGYIEGKGFQTIRLSDYKGKWIVLCFYPGDFTFV